MCVHIQITMNHFIHYKGRQSVFSYSKRSLHLGIKVLTRCGKTSCIHEIIKIRDENLKSPIDKEINSSLAISLGNA